MFGPIWPLLILFVPVRPCLSLLNRIWPSLPRLWLLGNMVLDFLTHSMSETSSLEPDGQKEVTTQASIYVSYPETNTIDLKLLPRSINLYHLLLI